MYVRPLLYFEHAYICYASFLLYICMYIIFSNERKTIYKGINLEVMHARYT